jgi:hypothetical protein
VALRRRCSAFLRHQLPDGPDMQLHALASEGDVEAANQLHAQATAAQGTQQQPMGGNWGIHPFYVHHGTDLQPTNRPTDVASGEMEADEGQQGVAGATPAAAQGGGGREERAAPGVSFVLRAPTSARNAYRVLRALTLRKAVLLEGSPGVGKTALVAALARQAGIPLVRDCLLVPVCTVVSTCASMISTCKARDVKQCPVNWFREGG